MEERKINISEFLPSKEKLEMIKSAFEKFGIERLSSIYNYFNGNFSYDDIRLARIILKSGRMK